MLQRRKNGRFHRGKGDRQKRIVREGEIRWIRKIRGSSYQRSIGLYNHEFYESDELLVAVILHGIMDIGKKENKHLDNVFEISIFAKSYSENTKQKRT